MIKPKLLLATNNKGKLGELRVLLKGIPYEMVSPAECGLYLDVKEDGKTYAANARLKASAFADASGLLTLADDSGLEVDALNGAPGVLSSRYAGPGANDAKRVSYLLDKLKEVPPERRSARFRCVIAITSPYDGMKICSGSCRGVITIEPKGDNGFGYDPIFYFPKLGKTMAELSSETKNRISHRARAAVRARKFLIELSKIK
jgi:XTP/dITP diphosphohydrolase